MVDERFFRKAMGICVPDPDTILLATLFQIIKFRNVLEPGQQINNVFDACYVPREVFITGELDVHDIGQLADGRIVFVNTLYNCLATPSARHSFTPIWKPPFISKIVKEDRCHLNGLAMAGRRAALRHRGEQVRHHRRLARPARRRRHRHRRGDGRDRDRRAVDAAFAAALSRQAVGAQLRHRRARLDRARRLGRRLPSSTCSPSAPASCAGSPFTASMPSSACPSPATSASKGWRSTRKLAAADSEPWCGVQVIDLDTGACAHWFRIDGPVAELYDVGVVPGAVRPMSLGFASSEILELITHDPYAPDGR